MTAPGATRGGLPGARPGAAFGAVPPWEASAQASGGGPDAAGVGGTDEPSALDDLIARVADRLRPALGPGAAEAVAREVVLDAARFALGWAGA